MNLPVSHFGRDELYTFICGLGVAAIWYVYLESKALLPEVTSMFEPFPIMLCLLSALAVYLPYLILSKIIMVYIDSKLKNTEDDVLVDNMKITKYLTFYYAGSLDEVRVSNHLKGLLTIVLLFIFQPLMFLFNITTELKILMSFVLYACVNVFVLLEFYLGVKQLLNINALLNRGLCGVLDEKIYNQKRAEHYAQLMNREYQEIYNREIAREK